MHPIATKPWRVVLLEADTVSRGDVSFDAFLRRWDCAVFSTTTPAQGLERIKDADVIVVNKLPIDVTLLTSAEACKLKLVAVSATGVNNVDLDAARARGVSVYNVPGYAAHSVAQFTIGLILELAAQMGGHRRDVLSGAWSRSRFFCLLTRDCVELHGKTLGIVGYGAIGQQMAVLSRAFGMRVLVSARPGVDASAGAPARGRTPWSEVLERSDILSLHCPLTPATHHLIDAEALGRMKPSAFLINTARGDLVDETALIAALREGRLAGAAVDVLSQEPPDLNHPMLRAASEFDSLIITPHAAWITREARQRLVDEVARNIEAFSAGAERNRVA